MEEITGETKQATAIHYIWQPIGAMIFFGVFLVLINWTATSKMLWVACVGALAASAYTVFVFPTSLSSRWINILGGYVFALVFGELLHWLAVFFEWVVSQTFAVPSVHVYEFTAFVGLLIVIWVMLLLRLSHPPAIVIIIALMMNVHNYMLLLVTLLGGLVLTILKVLLFPVLKDLTY